MSVFDVGNRDNCTWIVGGASGDPASPHYTDQHQAWSRCELIPAGEVTGGGQHLAAVGQVGRDEPAVILTVCLRRAAQACRAACRAGESVTNRPQTYT